MRFPFERNPDFTRYESLLLRLNDLTARGEDMASESETIREEMDRLFRRLSAPERARLAGLSSDLYMLQDGEIYERFEGAPEALRDALLDSWIRRDWEMLLSLLRKGSGVLSPEAIAFFRFSAYDALGQPEAALSFLRHAARLNPREAVYVEMLLSHLLRMNRFDEAATQAEPLLEAPATPPHIRINAIYALARTAGKLSEKEARARHSRIVALLERLLDGVRPSLQLTPALIAGAYTLLGSSQESLGNPAAARSAYDRALRRKPDYVEAWTARGLLRLESDPPGALSDFEQAIALGTTSLSPYLHLVRHLLSVGNYKRSLEYSLRILDLTDDPRIREAALRWITLAYSHLHRPDDTVRETSAADSYAASSPADPFDASGELGQTLHQDRERTLDDLPFLTPRPLPEARLLAPLVPSTPR